MGTPQPVEWPDIGAFLDRSGVRLDPWEIEILERIDDLFIYRDEPSEPMTRRMSEKLFDALFA